MITFDDAEKQKLTPEELKELEKHNDINEWPCPLSEDMKKQMHDSFKVVPKCSLRLFYIREEMLYKTSICLSDYY